MSEIEGEQREKFLALYRAGGLAENAHKLDNRWTVKEYNATRKSDEYKAFAKEYTLIFSEGIEGFLLGRLQRLADEVDKLVNTHPNFPKLCAEYRETLKLTEPIIVKAKQVIAEACPFNLKELRIKGLDAE